MSSLRNSLHRRNHKERSQLSHRAKFGILEKHKDYVLRARDYHSKQDRIQRLRQKAADRNKDEFYFGMNRQKTQKGIHVQDRGNSSMPVDMVNILKTQDENYVRTMRAAGLKKIEKLKAQLTALADLIAPHLLSNGEEGDDDKLEDEELDVLRQAGIIQESKSSKRKSKQASKHIIFVDNEDEASEKTLEPDSDMLDLGWRETKESKKSRKGKAAQMEGEGAGGELMVERREIAKKHRTRLLKELSARLIRDTQLRYAERELAMQRMLMGRGGCMKLRGVEKVEGGNESDELNEDELDSMKIKKTDNRHSQNDKTYKPRVYKWRLERKK
ncbi:u3 small nucleolar RNA-associated protein 11 [Phellopilus nigrolimitatus]|nr:u3 small nucleolar RNA-associated protein 11 [Phellopilus nigrolimitatus]